MGSVARIHKVNEAISKEKIKRFIKEKKRTQVRTLKIKTFEYSAMKIKAKRPAPNSTLNPETNSASPSGRSNGARFVSAKIEMIHGMIRGKKINAAINLIL
jgi:hypothetical protein